MYGLSPGRANVFQMITNAKVFLFISTDFKETASKDLTVLFHLTVHNRYQRFDICVKTRWVFHPDSHSHLEKSVRVITGILPILFGLKCSSCRVIVDKKNSLSKPQGRAWNPTASRIEKWRRGPAIHPAVLATACRWQLGNYFSSSKRANERYPRTRLVVFRLSFVFPLRRAAY